jgi:hypothetical protein
MDAAERYHAGELASLDKGSIWDSLYICVSVSSVWSEPIQRFYSPIDDD